jgi:hypothetical protein
MYKSSRAFDANERVQRYRKSVSAVHENILLFKGFLGPTIKDNDALQSVGMRAARAAGVIVDSAGKLRCPPGTPNANQFTDMQMSNCLIPSAETLAAQAVNAVQRFVDGFKFKKGRLAKHKVDQKPANLGIPDADGFNNPVGAFDNSLGITNRNDAISAVANGADLNQIPDEFLMDAIYNNAIPPEGGNGRFKGIGTGGGVHGMDRFLDTKTGQMLGAKFRYGSPTGELASEVLSASVLEEFGYPAMSMRVVGTGGDLGVVTELVHNKYEGELSIGAGQFLDDENEIPTVDSMAHVFLLDLALGNSDRHGGNYLTVNDGEQITIAPIDHGNAIFRKNTPIFNEDGTAQNIAKALQMGNRIKNILGSFFGENSDPNKRKERAELIQAIEKSLADIREIDADALGGKLKKILQDMSDSLPPEVASETTIQRTLDIISNGPMNDLRGPEYGRSGISDIDALVGRLKELQSKSAEEVADAFFPAPKDAPQDPVSQLDSFALDLDIPTPDLADGEILSEFGEDTAGVNPFAKAGEGAPLVSAREAEGLIGVTFDPDEFNDQVNEKLDSFLAEHVPNQLGDLTEKDLDKIEKSIGLTPTDRDMTTQIEDAITFLTDPENGMRGQLLKNLENAVDEQDKEYARQLIKTIDDIAEKLKTPEGKEEVKAILIKNYAQLLSGIEDIHKKYPHLRGKFSVNIEKTPEKNSWYAGFAGHVHNDEGRIDMYIQVTPLSLVIDSLQSGESVQDGDMLLKTARIEGTDSYQITLAVHEAIHIAHFDKTARDLGFEIGSNAPPLMDQLEAIGPNIGDTYLGLLYAREKGLDPTTPISDIKSKTVLSYGTNTHARSFSMFINNFINRDRRLVRKEQSDDNPVKTFELLFPVDNYGDGASQKQRIFAALIDSLNGNWGSRFYKQPENLQTTEDIQRELSNALGQDFDEFVGEFKTAIVEMFGTDVTNLHTSGISVEEIKSVLGISSQYGGTDILESVAEAGTVNYLIDNFNGSRIMDQTQIDKTKDMLERIIPSAPEKAKQKAMTAEVQKMMDKLYDAFEKMPELEMDENKPWV